MKMKIDKRQTILTLNDAGLEALEKALYCWEDALTAFSSSFSNDTLALPSKADAAFTHDVQELLDMGYQIQTQAELLFIDQVCANLPTVFFPVITVDWDESVLSPALLCLFSPFIYLSRNVEQFSGSSS